MAAAAASSASSSAAAAVAATATATAGPSEASVLIHPMVIMNITDHLTRVQQQGSPDTQRVYGVLYGKQRGMAVEVCTSFELSYAPRDDGGITLDKKYLEENISLLKEVFTDYELVGWYATGTGPQAVDMQSHKDILAYNDNPILMTLDSSIDEGQKDLPIAMYESIFATGADGARSLVFSPMPYKVEAGEAESVTLDAVANTRPDDAGESIVVHTYHKQINALQRLSERVAVLQRYLLAIQRGQVAPSPRLMRLVSEVVARVPTSDSTPFRNALLSEFGDTLLTTLVASLTKGTSALNGALSKLELAKDAAAFKRRRGGRGDWGAGAGGGGMDWAFDDDLAAASPHEV